MFKLKTIQGDSFLINEQEYQAYLNTPDNGHCSFFKSGLKISIKKSMVAIVMPEEDADEIEETKNQQIGILHDGTAVRKEYGRWVVDREEYSENGYKLDLEYPNPQEYPEIARECVPTYKQYEKLKHLALPERLKAILGYEILPTKKIIYNKNSVISDECYLKMFNK